MTLCFPRWDQTWLCPIALTPLICAIWFGPVPARRAWLRHALLGYATGFVFFAGTFYWLGTLGTLFQSVWLYGLPPLLGLYMGLYFAFWAWFIGALERGDYRSSSRNLLVAALGAAAWVMQEWMRGWMLSGFGWNGLGVALHANLALIQIAEFTGVAGPSFLVAFCNLIAVLVVRRIRGEAGPGFLKRVRWEFTASVALVAIVFALGVRTLLNKREHRGETLRVAAVQANIAQEDKFSADAEAKIFRQLDKLTLFAAAADPQLLLWSESATPKGMFEDETNHRFVVEQSQRGDFALLIGTLDFDLEKQEDYNVAALLTDRGRKVQTYRKMHLVPFGEYLPFRHRLPLVTKVIGGLVPGDFTAGREFTLLHLPSPKVELGALICFEDTLGDLTRRFVLNGAEVLVNLTNDGWFLHSAAAEQQLANAVFRSVENRRPLVRCANTGVTCAVDEWGRVDRWLAPFEEGFAQREITLAQTPPLTFYTRHGEVFAMVCAAMTVVIILGRLKKPVILNGVKDR